MYQAGIVTVSDRAFQGVYEDRSGPEIQKALIGSGFAIKSVMIVPDEIPEISRALVDLADVKHMDLVLTTGGTGLSPRDVTPEATQAVIERQVAGLAEYVRQLGMACTPKAALSRALAGTRNQTLIVNLPGSPKAIQQVLPDLVPVLLHGIEMMRGQEH